jgi:hypothetical protein
MATQLRLSPSGAPLGLIGQLGDGIPFLRRMTAAFNTVEYRPPTTLTRIEGPAAASPAQIDITIPAGGTTGRYRLIANLALALRCLTPTAPPAPNSKTIVLRLQQALNAGAFGNMLFDGTATSGNGLNQHIIGAETATEVDESFAVSGDHVFTAVPGDIIRVRAAWSASAGGFQDVVSSYASESFANGGWHLEAFLAEEPALVA